MIDNRKCMEGRNPILIFIGWIQRVFGQKEIYLINKYWSVDLSKCTQCLLCVNNCPTQSINFDGSHFTFLPTCTACMRCYNRCPTYAVCLFNKTCDPKKYRRFLGPDDGFSIAQLK